VNFNVGDRVHISGNARRFHTSRKVDGTVKYPYPKGFIKSYDAKYVFGVEWRPSSWSLNEDGIFLGYTIKREGMYPPGERLDEGLPVGPAGGYVKLYMVQPLGLTGRYLKPYVCFDYQIEEAK
jgi:hypothetical protein